MATKKASLKKVKVPTWVLVHHSHPTPKFIYTTNILGPTSMGGPTSFAPPITPKNKLCPFIIKDSRIGLNTQFRNCLDLAVLVGLQT
jgi:hypothetical protein